MRRKGRVRPSVWTSSPRRGRRWGQSRICLPSRRAGEAARSSHRSVFVRRDAVRDGNRPRSRSGNHTSAVIFEAILNRVPTSPVQLNPGLPPQLEIILNKALEKDRELRCQSAAELRADLKRLKRDTDSSRAGVIRAGTSGATAPALTSEEKARGEKESQRRQIAGVVLCPLSWASDSWLL